VVKATAPGATSVEKELEAEKLVQETVRRGKKLRSHGRPAIGKIVTAQATDIFRPTVEGRARCTQNIWRIAAPINSANNGPIIVKQFVR
jgi:hypothetical protein